VSAALRSHPKHAYLAHSPRRWLPLRGRPAQSSSSSHARGLAQRDYAWCAHSSKPSTVAPGRPHPCTHPHLPPSWALVAAADTAAAGAAAAPAPATHAAPSRRRRAPAAARRPAKHQAAGACALALLLLATKAACCATATAKLLDWSMQATRAHTRGERFKRGSCSSCMAVSALGVTRTRHNTHLRLCGCARAPLHGAAPSECLLLLAKHCGGLPPCWRWQPIPVAG
jgi:hypothetical protein